MTSVHLHPSSTLEERVIRRRRLKAILLPVEHGGWGLTLEPLVAGLIVAPSFAGLAIALAIITAFLSRQPLRIVTRSGQNPERARIALIALCIEGLLIAAMVAFAVFSGASKALLLLVAFSPLALFLLYMDRARRSRELAAEIAAALYMSCGAVALGLAGGTTVVTACVLGALLAARALGAILHVREQVNVMKGRPAARSVSIVLHAAALAGAIVAVGYGLVNLFAPVAFAILFGRAIFPPHPRSAAQLGWVEVKAGLASVLLISLSLM